MPSPDDDEIVVKLVRVAQQACAKRGCGNKHVYKVEMPHRVRLYCLEHASEYVDLARLVTGIRLRLEHQD